MNMKRMTALLLACLLLSCACAEPYASAMPRVCTAIEVDVSGVKLENGRLTGEVRLPEKAGQIRLLIDCPLPEAFSADQQQKLTVSFRKITREMLAEAMASIGHPTSGGELRQFISDPLSPMAVFELEKALSYAPVIPQDTAGHAKPAEMENAAQILRQLAGALDIPLSESFFSMRRNTFEDLSRIHPGESSASAQLIGRNERSFAAQEKKYGNRSGGDEITLLRAMTELYGLPVMNQRYWRKGGETFGASSEVLAAVHDDGRLVMAEVWGVPVVEKTQDMPVPETDWQTLLKNWISACYHPMSQLNEYEENSDLFGTVIHYGTYEVITRIAPCWVGREKYTLEPGWYGVVEKRLLNGEAAVYESLHCAAAEDMERVF